MTTKNTFKVVVLGEGRVGKTSLTLKYCAGQFNENEESTINASYLDKELTFEGQPKKLAVWDTAGQEKFDAMAPIYYRDAEGAVLVYDITYRESLNKVQKWILELRQHAGEDIFIVIAGNKCDRENERQIDQDEAEEFAKKYGAKHFNTSAKTGRGIEDMFKHLATQIYEKNRQKFPKKIRLAEGKKKSTSEKCC